MVEGLLLYEGSVIAAAEEFINRLALNGSLLWQTDLGSDGSFWQTGAPVAVNGSGAIVVGSIEVLNVWRALNSTTGNELWFYDVLGTCVPTGASATAAFGEVVLVSCNTAASSPSAVYAIAALFYGLKLWISATFDGTSLVWGGWTAVGRLRRAELFWDRDD